MFKECIKLCKCEHCNCVFTFTQDESAVDCPDCQEAINTSKVPATWEELDAYLRNQANG